jgi:cytochrome c oxidase subunit 2
MPQPISAAAEGVNSQFFLTLVVTGVAFVLAQGLLGWFIFKYRDRPGTRVRYVHGNNTVEVGGALVVAVVFVALAVMGQRVWAGLHLSSSAADAVRIEITGEQFAWNVRYPGPDGQFGRTDPKLYDPNSNPVGIVPDDPAGLDDIVALNNLAVPVDRPIELSLGSKDVLHSLFLPQLYIKQDTVPGMRIPLRFTARQAGEYEIPCAELCGLGHYRMKGALHVMQPADFAAWLVEQKAQ